MHACAHGKTHCPDPLTVYIWFIVYHAGNFHLISAGSGTAKHLQVLADSSIKLGLNTADDTTGELLPSTGYLLPELQNDMTIDIDNSASVTGSGDEPPQCNAVADVGSMESQWHIEQPDRNTGIRLYTLDEKGEKWYLRAHFYGRTVDLVCEDHVASIANVRKE